MGQIEGKSAEVAARAIKRSRDIIQNDRQLQQLMPRLDVTSQLTSDTVSCERMLDTILQTYEDRNAVGSRYYETIENKTTGQVERKYLPAFTEKTFGCIRQEAKAIATSWRHHVSAHVKPDEFVAIMGFAGSEYFSIDCATVYNQSVSVPLQSASAGADLSEIFTRIQPVCLATSYEDLSTALELALNTPSLRSLIVFDIDLSVTAERMAFEAAQKSLETTGITLLTFSEIVELGRTDTFEFLSEHPEGNERLALIIHSSGSTGVPKGAMISAKTVKHYWIGSPEKHPTVTVIFSPLNHLLGRAGLLQVLGKGSTVYFTLAPDMSTLFEDIRLARPTWLAFFPRVLDMIFQHYQNEVVKRVSDGLTAEAAKTKTMEDMRHSFLGDRLTTATVGSAPTSQSVKDFMADCFQVWMWDGYGSTEAGSGSVTINGIINRQSVLDYKLRDVPELGYYLTDKPYPRGEFCFKGKNQIKGFYKDPEATKKLLTDDGYIITGDIVEEHEQDKIVIIDRRKDVVKLSQGEYVAVGPLGAVFEGGSPFIKQIYIYGNSHQAYLVAVIVPDIEALTHAKDGVIEDTDIRSTLREAILDVAKTQQLKSFEAPRDFIIETEPFSQKNGLLSSVRKKLRPALKKKYGEALEALYTSHAQGRDADISALKNERFKRPTADTLKRLIALHLRLKDDVSIAEDKNFSDLGGDSLGAVNYSLLIEDVFDVIFPADKILDPTGNIGSWAKDIEVMRSIEGDWPSFKSIHGAETKTVHAKDLNLSAFLPADILTQARDLPAASQTPHTLFLTGVTGFLGRHVCLKWLAELPKNGCLICLVRASDDQSAQDRLNAVFADSSAEMQQQFTQLSKGRIEVIAGDISLPNFGLSKNKFADLANRVDRISHVGALVNHRLGYEHLFAPNVAGTAEIIKLALSGTRKPIDFVSTISVLSLLDRENTDKEAAAPAESIPLSDAYASGYATSKWAAEILLREASDTAGIPVNILRGNMMLAHRTLMGAINPSDMFTRLLFSLITTAITPKSFYRGDPVPYDGLPVDLIAATVVGMWASETSDVRVMNACNYTEGASFSLDDIVSSIRKAGYLVEEIADYQDWFERFSNRLHTLADDQKQKSALDLLPAFKAPQSNRLQQSFDNFSHVIKSREGALPELNHNYTLKILNDMKIIGLLTSENSKEKS